MTLTVAVFLMLPRVAVTVIVAVPSPTGVTAPSATVAIFDELVFQLYVACAVSGDRLGVRVRLSPRFRFTVPVLSSFTPVGLYGSTTLTFTVAVFLILPRVAVTVMVAVPSPTGVTTPWSTVATFTLLEIQL